MHPRVLYLGDGTLATAARYLAGVMTHFRIPFDHVPTERRFTGKRLRRTYTLFILSDYPARHLPKPIQQEMVRRVEEGAALLMIGGWSSFTGLDGHYRGTPIGRILPVTLSRKDDRVNTAGGAVLFPKKRHPVLKGLSFRTAPVIAGFNRVTAKGSSEVVLEARKILARGTNVALEKRHYPLLVFSRYGKGKVAALATDVAPHWVGSWVDWGRRRILVKISRNHRIEVGEYYLRLLGSLLQTLQGARTR
ncbi:MAG: glutamine amidotransferase [Candidatus Omnitrophota bacterium]